jgi:1-pyrroline-5-carboxylate dehydrogenase
MNNASVRVPDARNESVLEYLPGSPERAALKAELDRVASEELEIPCIIGGERVSTGRLETVVMPHDHQHALAHAHCAGPTEVERAVLAAHEARREWANMPWEARVAVFLRAAELLAGEHRQMLNATTMLGQSKTCYQAEIDASCELIDFWRFNCSYAQQLYAQQPNSPRGVWNMTELRPLEGFVFALTPFNFTAIGANLPTAPALMGNAVLWKPAESQVLSAYYTYLLLEEAGLPPGVINFLPGHGAELAPVIMDRPELAGLHFTGSTAVFRSLWQRAAGNIDRYRTYPRLVGETGGKDFIVAHPSADDAALITAIVRGAFEYQGQKCSAASRLYISESQWGRIKDELTDTINSLDMGDVRDFRNFMGAVIKAEAFAKHKAAIDQARASNDAHVIAGGECDDRQGWFVRPTLIRAATPDYRTMQEELFGPIVTAFVYPDARWSQTLRTVDETSPFALTGAVFASDRAAIVEATDTLRNAAGNFYINDKPTGAVVGQQPFGGARASGTNDKAGSAANLSRWTSARTIKETFTPATVHTYGHMREA